MFSGHFPGVIQLKITTINKRFKNNYLKARK